jgi:hypothetical protein
LTARCVFASNSEVTGEKAGGQRSEVSRDHHQDRGGLKLIDFEDPDGNRLHLAEVKWSPNKASEAQEREYQND